MERSSWQEDVRLIRQANMNHVFTSHYPDPEEFLDVCDEMGLYVGSEAPFVWTDFRYTDDPKYVDYFLRPAAEMLEYLSNHPSIVFWQMGDEATWGRNFDTMQRLVNAVDQTRPVNFAYGWTVNTISFDAVHYPRLNDIRPLPPKKKKPTTYDQYCNVNTFNRRELLTDPGVRDYWGTAIEPMWEAIYATPAVAEAAIWAWVDEYFYVPPAAHDATKYKGYLDKQTGFVKVGYGNWGLVDKWRRPKPEYWHVKKTYSPVHIRERILALPPAGQPFRIPVENRYDFTNLNELRVEWSLGAATGTAKVDIGPRSSGEILIPAAAPIRGKAGVRNLEREIGNVCRKVARKVVKEGVNYNVTITGENVNDFLGVIKFRDTLAHEKSEVGLVTGLAWTEVGGSILSTEASVVDGKGKLTLTGKLGDVMQESAQAAMSYVRSRAQRLGLSRDFYRNLDLHVHVPEGAIPKDGPSAGITIATAISSALSKIPVRRDLAMTGEITLRGEVLPIGGLKEKLLAAHRAGLFEVILPKDNEKDVAEVPENLRTAMKTAFRRHHGPGPTDRARISAAETVG